MSLFEPTTKTYPGDVKVTHVPVFTDAAEREALSEAIRAAAMVVANAAPGSFTPTQAAEEVAGAYLAARAVIVSGRPA